MIRYAVIGTNFITDRFIESTKECDNIKFHGVYSRDINRAREYGDKNGAKLVFDKLNDLAECDEIDMVYIASPNSFHCSQSILMLKSKKHVLCEKPIASNSKELKKMIKAASDNNTILLEAMRTVYDPGFLEIEKNLNKLGKIRRANFYYCKYSSRYDNFKKGVIENAFKPELSNGALMDIGVYCVHALARLFGAPNEVKAQSIILENGIDGAGTIIAKYDEMQADLMYSKIADSYIPSEIQGEDGTMVIDMISEPKDITIYYRDGRKEKISVDKKQNNMYYEAMEMVRLIENPNYEKDYNKYSLIELNIMDEVREQTGIHFPADR